jgi:hypothetical protein
VFFICQRVRARCCWVRCATVHANDGARRSAGPGGPRGDGAVVLAGGYVRVREPRRRAGDARVDGCSWGASFFRLLLATARWKAGLHSLRGRAGHHPPPRGIGWSGVNVPVDISCFLFGFDSCPQRLESRVAVVVSDASGAGHASNPVGHDAPLAHINFCISPHIRSSLCG